MPKSVLFSVVIPTYNRAGFIIKTLNTILEQDFQDFEVIVVDDGSTDNTLELLKEINDHRLSIVSIKNSERAAARNRGAEAATGTYVNFFDSDDLALKHHLSTAAEAIQQLNNPEVFHLNFEIRDTENNLVKTGRLYQPQETANSRLVMENTFSCNGVFLRRDIALAHPFNEDRALSVSEDYELWIRLGSRFPLHMVNKVTSIIVLHEMRSVFAINEKKLLDRKNLLMKYSFEDPEVRKAFGKHKKTIEAFTDTYIALHLIMGDKLMLGARYFIKAILLDYKCLNDRRTFGIIKQFILGVGRKLKFSNS
jgi:glycosyltransferase involved in cell wall biosynthesis